MNRDKWAGKLLVRGADFIFISSLMSGLYPGLSLRLYNIMKWYVLFNLMGEGIAV